MRYALTDVIEEILGVPVPERSQNAMVRCPVHGDQHASMSIDLDRGLFVCFACGVRGGINTLARLMEKDVNEADVLTRTLEVAIERGFEEAPDFTALAKNLHEEAYATRSRSLIEYLASKDLAGAVVQKFSLGWDAGRQRISMPYWDDDRCIAIKYRYADGSKDNEKGGRRYIYNVNDLREGRAVAILCEGESDVHATYSQVLKAGVADRVAVVGFPGASASKSNWELMALEFMWTGKVYVAYDADDAGDKGARVPLEVLQDRAERARPTKGKDMADHFLSGGTLADMGIVYDTEPVTEAA